MTDPRPADHSPGALPLPARTEECRPELLPAAAVELARRTFESLLTRFSSLLPAYLNVPASLRFASMEQLFLSEVPTTGEDCTVGLDLSPVPGRAHLILGRTFVNSALVILLGATTDVADAPRESLTDVDLHVLRGLIEVVVTELRETWRPVCGVSFRVVPPGLTSGPVQAEEGEQSVVALTAEIRLRDHNDTIRLILPSLLMRLASELISLSGEAQRSALLAALGSASLQVEGVLSGGGIPVRDLLQLKPGRILELPHKADTPIECRVNGVTKLSGELVHSGKSVAFQIQSCGTAADPPEDSPDQY